MPGATMRCRCSIDRCSVLALGFGTAVLLQTLAVLLLPALPHDIPLSRWLVIVRRQTPPPSNCIELPKREVRRGLRADGAVGRPWGAQSVRLAPTQSSARPASQFVNTPRDE